jgi:hypothetical protein
VKRIAWSVLGVLLLCGAAWARPGGGQSFSGGGGGGGGGRSGGGGNSYSSGGSSFSSGGSSSGGSSSGGSPILFLVIFGILVIAVVGKQLTSGRSNQGWQTGYGDASPDVEPPRPPIESAIPRTALEQLRPVDPEFSNVLFEDFVYMLYAEIQRARAHGFASIAAFVSPEVARSLVRQDLGDVRGVIIGAMRIVGFAGVQFPMVQVELELESNYAEIDKSGKEHRFYVVDRMTLARARTAKSRPPKRARTLDCPNCGAPLSAMRGTQCSYCKQDTGAGRFDWNVEAFGTNAREPRGPLLTSNVEEAGTDLPTIVSPGSKERMDQLQQRDPTFAWNTFQARVGIVFDALQQGWSGRDPARIRPFVTDNLFQSMMYWIDLYVQQRCRNMNDGARVQQIMPANVLSDPHYDSITVRVYAVGCDYTISDEGKILSGSRTPRTYSEYWTFVRSATKQGASKGDLACPNCGAPLKISMVGNCDHCGVKVTSGEFDWVLSRIEQDEVYTG